MGCPYCKRHLSPWLLKRPNKCAPDYWANCIRNQPTKLLTMEDIKRACAEDYV
jgi:hypothetical protein